MYNQKILITQEHDEVKDIHQINSLQLLNYIKYIPKQQEFIIIYPKEEVK